MDSMNMMNNVDMIVGSINAFAARMMRVEKMPLSENMTLSPFSLWTALNMAVSGADGDTRKEMESVTMPGLEDSEDMRMAYQALMKMVSDDSMLSANAMFAAPSVMMKDDFKRSMATCFGAAARVLPANPQDASRDVNTFVQDMTKGEIRDMMDAKSMDQMRLMLVSAAHFKSMWATAFDKSATKVASFSMLDQRACMDVPMMAVEGSFKVMRNAQVQMIEMPYDGNKFVMNIVMPVQNTMEAWGRMIKDVQFVCMRNVSPSQIKVSMPRLAMNYKNNFVPHLQEMGMNMAFTQQADFSRMCDKAVNMNAVMHDAMVEINEEGTAAGAGTISRMVSSMIGSADEFKVDRPFVYCIKHAETNVVMFMGMVLNPSPVTAAM